MELTEQQKTWVLKESKKETNLNILTQKCFRNPNIDGRSKEGRAIRDFLKDNDVEYKTITIERKEREVELTKENKEFIESNIETGMNSFAMAKLIFPNIEKLSPLHRESRIVLEYIKDLDQENKYNKEVSEEYSPPKATSRILKKINDACGKSLTEDVLTKKQEILVDNLGVNLNNSRFIMIMNNIKNVDERNLFEQDFVRHTWDKEDLSAEEVSLYINLCKDFLNLEQCHKHMERLKEMFEEATGSDDESKRISMTLSDSIKVKSDEYDKVEKRIQSLVKVLQGDRTRRMEDRQRGASSVLSLVEEFQNEESRDHLVRMANISKEIEKEEINRIESMSEYKARVLGIRKHDAV